MKCVFSYLSAVAVVLSSGIVLGEMLFLLSVAYEVVYKIWLYISEPLLLQVCVITRVYV